jgi:hypothetical protein
LYARLSIPPQAKCRILRSQQHGCPGSAGCLRQQRERLKRVGLGATLREFTT